MSIIFEAIKPYHKNEIIDIFNFYVENSFAAYPETKIPYDFINMFLEIAKQYPVYVIKAEESDKIIGFCMLRSYSPFSSFKETVEIGCFIDKDYVGRGIGRKALYKLEDDAKNLGVKTILASITSENAQSIMFHKNNGFIECGRLGKVGKKFGKYFDIVLMQKVI